MVAVVHKRDSKHMSVKTETLGIIVLCGVNVQCVFSLESSCENSVKESYYLNDHVHVKVLLDKFLHANAPSNIIPNRQIETTQMPSSW